MYSPLICGTIFYRGFPSTFILSLSTSLCISGSLYPPSVSLCPPLSISLPLSVSLTASLCLSFSLGCLSPFFLPGCVFISLSLFPSFEQFLVGVWHVIPYTVCCSGGGKQSQTSAPTEEPSKPPVGHPPASKQAINSTGLNTNQGEPYTESFSTFLLNVQNVVPLF